MVRVSEVNPRFSEPEAKMSKSPDQRPLVYAEDREAWRNWLAANHQTSDGIWLVYYKKRTGKPSVSYDDVVDECLCFGWIDSKVNSIDHERYKQLITPRKNGSVWSKINKAKAAKLIDEGRMTPSGLSKIDAAKADGSWRILDAVEALEIPPDLASAFTANPEAHKQFAAFNKSSKKNILFWIISAKRPETRKKRIDETVALAAQGIKAKE